MVGILWSDSAGLLGDIVTSFVVVIGFGVFAWYGCNVFMPQLKGLSK